MTAERTLTDRLLDDADQAPIDPFDLFEEWFAAARASEPNDPHAMAIATVDADGLPDVRMVLLNAHDRRGFAFFTNFESAKGRELLAHPKAAFVMHWKSLRRQFRVRGAVEVVDAAEADAYFHSRARGSQIASSASEQSRPRWCCGVALDISFPVFSMTSAPYKPSVLGRGGIKLVSTSS
ncbi:MAG: pyridoxal 5'-phosphate synthase, partial [Devosia nanyangense]|nr:pyridoxal 5'-phosphate synthase [Devosia nanyangense]